MTRTLKGGAEEGCRAGKEGGEAVLGSWAVSKEGRSTAERKSRRGEAAAKRFGGAVQGFGSGVSAAAAAAATGFCGNHKPIAIALPSSFVTYTR